MRTIKVDDEVFEYLQHQAMAFVDTPNDVLRRLLLPLSGDEDSTNGRLRSRLKDSAMRANERSVGATVPDMRARAIHHLEAALSTAHGKPVAVDQSPIPGKRGPREQRYSTPGDQ